MFRLMKRYGKPYRIFILWVLIFQIAQTLATIYLPTINADIIDNGVVPGNITHIWHQGIIMLIIAITQVIFSICAIYFATRVAVGFGSDMRSGIYRKIVTFSNLEVQKFGIGSLITRNTSDVQQVQALFVSIFTIAIAAPMMLIGGVIMSLRQDIVLARIIVVSVISLAIILGIIVSLMVKLSQIMQQNIDQVNSFIREKILGIRIIRVFVRDNYELKKFTAINTKLTNTIVDFGKINALIFPTVMLIVNISSVAVIWFGAIRIQENQMELGALIAFLSYLIQILMSVLMSTFILIMLPRAIASSKRIRDILDSKTPTIAAQNPQEFGAYKTITFKNVEFFYEEAEKPALSNINLNLKAGENLAIIGGTGSGKTTLVNLIPRLTEINQGELKINDISVSDVGLAKLRKQIALVPQESYLFYGTIRENLLYGNPQASTSQIFEALAIAQAKQFVTELPENLEYKISQGGKNLSGGQRQRLAIARAILAEPKILIFDDAFSALDTKTDTKLQKALKNRFTNSSIIIVTQRISTIKNVNNIIVLESGKIVGSGNHSELIKNCSAYQETVDSQMNRKI